MQAGCGNPFKGSVAYAGEVGEKERINSCNSLRMEDKKKRNKRKKN
jgi:hypothetical protein